MITTILHLIISDNGLGDRELLMLMGMERAKLHLGSSLSGCAELQTMTLLEKVPVCIGPQ